MGGAEMMADRVQRLVAGDGLIRLYGIEVEEASADLARVSALVKEEFLQVHGLAHGAFVFALLDVAFALNVNATHDAVAVQWSISQFRSGVLGERLTAESRLLHRGRRLMVVELVATGEGGKLVAKGQATAIPVGETAAPRRRC
jgi:acyl-CoA thioesterase